MQNTRGSRSNVQKTSVTILVFTMTKNQLNKLTKTALKRLYSPPTARRLWELHGIGVSVGTLARARKVLDGFGVTPGNDGEWTFDLIHEWYREEIGLRMHCVSTHTIIEVVMFSSCHLSISPLIIPHHVFHPPQSFRIHLSAFPI